MNSYEFLRIESSHKIKFQYFLKTTLELSVKMLHEVSLIVPIF